MRIKLICLAIALMIPATMFGGNDIMEKQLLQYKYVMFIQEISLDSKEESKFYFIENKAEIQGTINWLKEYYPDRNALDAHMRTIMAHCWIVFTNELPGKYADISKIKRDLFFNMFMNFNIDGKKYFTKEQLALLYKIFEEKGVPLKFNNEPKN